MCMHNKVFGKDSVIELEAINRNLKKACPARREYLERQVQSFRAWLAKNGCDDIDAAVAKIIFNHFDIETHVSDIQVDTALAVPDRNQEEFSLAKEGELLAEQIVSKSMRVSMGDLSFYQDKLDGMYCELRLHDAIQDAIDALRVSMALVVPVNTALDVAWHNLGVVKGYIMKLDRYHREGKLGYDGWVLMTNQLMVLIGKPEVKAKVLYLLPDRIQYFEKKMDEKRERIVFKLTAKDEKNLAGYEGIDAEGNLVEDKATEPGFTEQVFDQWVKIKKEDQVACNVAYHKAIDAGMLNKF